MDKSKITSKGTVLHDFVIPVCTVIISGLLSWLISVRTNSHSAVLDSQREVLQKESSVLNRISDIADESEMVNLKYVLISIEREVRITTYVSSIDKTVLGQDTTYTDMPICDTTKYLVPKFLVRKSSYDRVINDLSYVKSNLDLLSHATGKEVDALLSFVAAHPILFAGDEKTLADSEWREPEIYMTFINKVGQINQSYLKRLKKFGLD